MRRTPCRIDVFGPVTVQKRRGRKVTTTTVLAGWQAWNPDTRMERAMARLPGSGSFYWPTHRDAYRRALVLVRTSPEVTAARVETVSGRRIAYVQRAASGEVYAYAP